MILSQLLISSHNLMYIQLFYVEGKLSLPTGDQDFYELLCSHCGQQYRTHLPKIIHCASCKQRAMLTPRACFEVVMTDDNGSAVATLIGELGEKFLDMTAADICEIISVKEDLFQLPAPVASEEIGESSNTKLENVELKKEIENEDNIQSNVEQVTPREELNNELTTKGGSSTKRQQRGNKLNWRLPQEKMKGVITL
nr:uncharacterized protein LOC104098002 isoform X2 [Nicotiana tomentosiformis]